MAKIALEGIRFFAYHGLYPEEQKSGNHFEVDVYLDTGQRPLAVRDEIEETVDYAEVHRIVQEEMAIRANLLETLVRRIGERLVLEMTGFDRVTVRVSKENPPVQGECRRSYVEAEFERDGGV